MGVGCTYEDAQSLTMIRVKLIMLSTTTQIMKKINRWIKLYDGSVVVTTLNLSQKSRLNLFSDSMVEPGTISDHYICMGPYRIATSEPISFRSDRWLTMTRGLYRDMPPTHLQVSHPRGQTITFYGVLSWNRRSCDNCFFTSISLFLRSISFFLFRFFFPFLGSLSISVC